MQNGTKVRIRKEALASQDNEFKARVDEQRIAFVEKFDPHVGWAYIVFPRLGRKREFRAGWFAPKSLDVLE